MPDLSWVLYDTAVFGVALQTVTLFKVAENGDATHVSDFTNMRGSGGSLPGEENFEIRKLGISPESDLAEADEVNWLINSFVKINIANVLRFQAPLIWCVDRAAWGGHFAQAAAANRSYIGREGNGYIFDPKLQLPGGTSFDVQVVQGTVLTAAGGRIKVALEGILSIP